MRKFKILLVSLLALFFVKETFAIDEPSKATELKEPPPWASTAYGKRLYEESQTDGNMYAINLYEPNFILPYTYTFSPYYQVYANTIPGNQPLEHQEIEGQLSFKVPVARNVFRPYSTIDIAYTQLMMWQFYAKSPYFRETDYMPEVFLEQHYGVHWVGRYSMIHESNGRGIPLERSWNRLYAEAIYSDTNWVASVKPWITIWDAESQDLHNPDIRRYMGDGEIAFSYKMQNDIVFSVMVRNEAESSFERGAEEATMSFPLFGHFKGYVKVFSGYGQTLIEYNHFTNAVGIGVVLNDVI